MVCLNDWSTIVAQSHLISIRITVLTVTLLLVLATRPDRRAPRSFLEYSFLERIHRILLTPCLAPFLHDIKISIVH